MAKQTIEATVNLDALRAELMRALQRTNLLVGAALGSRDGISVAHADLTGKSVGLHYDAGLNWTDEELRSEFATWVLANGLRDAIESVSNFLESAHNVLSLWKLLLHQEGGMVLTGADWQEMVVKAGQKFHRLGFPDKLTHLQTEHLLGLDDSGLLHVSDINGARNCLVYRQGMVSERDKNTDTGLEVKWKRLSVVIQKDGSEKEFTGDPMYAEEGSVVAVRSNPESKLFALGDKVQFSSQEYADITWTLLSFGEDVVMKVNNIGLTKGFLQKPKGEGA
jgi:hypothetical protein